jgi:hypothetical protein
MMLAQAVGPSPLYEITTVAILVIPVAAIGIIYSRFLVAKTRLAVREAELEIEESERLLQEAPPGANVMTLRGARPLKRFASVQLLLLRAVLLYLALFAWSMISDAYRYAVNSAFLASSAVGTRFGPGWLPVVLDLVPLAGRLLIFLVIGWPIFVDANKLVGIELRDFSPFNRKVDPDCDDFDDGQPK